MFPNSHTQREVFFTKSPTEGQSEQQQQQAFKQPSLFEKPAGPSIFGGGSQSSGGGGLLGPKPQPSVFGGTPSVFGGNQSTPAMFGGNISKPVFGGQPVLGPQTLGTFPNQSSNIFGGTSNAFTNASQNTQQTSNMFGGAQGQTSTGSIFGGSNTGATVQGQATNSIFGEQNKGPVGNSLFSANNQNQSSVFGGQGTPTTMADQGNLFVNQQQNSLFSNSSVQQQQQQQTSSVFGSTNVFGNTTAPRPAQTAPQPSVFGDASGTPAPSVFGNTAGKSTNIFGGFGVNTTQSGNALFGGSNVFPNAAASGSTSTNTGLFGKPSDSSQLTGSSNLFGDSALHNQPQGSVGSVAVEHPEWYTPLDQLKQEEKAQFEAEAFTAIPLCPPPAELCAGMIV